MTSTRDTLTSEAASSWRGDGYQYKVQITHTRNPDDLGDPSVSGEEVFGQPQPRRSRIKACAAAAVLVAWREAATGGLIPALPSFISFVFTVVRMSLSVGTARVDCAAQPTCIDAGVAVCQIGILAGEMVRCGPRGNTLMLRRKMGETYEASAYAVLHSPPEQPKQELIRLFNCAVKTYKDMLVRAYVRFYPSRLKQIQRLTSCRSCRLAQASRIKLIIVFDRLTP
jgi:hypothetical protein